MIKYLIIFITIFLYANKNITLQLSWKYQFQFAGEIIAKEKGFYKKAGLNVKIQEWDGKHNLINYVLSHKNSIGISTSSLIEPLSQNKPIEILMPIFQSSPLALGIIGYKNINSLKDLETKHIPISSRIKEMAPIMSMLKIENIDMNKLNFVDFEINDFLHKKGAYLIYTSNEPYILQKRKIPFKIFNPKNYGLASYGDILFTSKNFTKNNKKSIEDFLQATKQGWKYAINHTDETIKLIMKKYNTQHKTYNDLKFEASNLKHLIGFKFNCNRLRNIKNIYILSGLVNNNINFKSHIFNPPIPVQFDKNFIKTHKIHCIATNHWAPFNFDINGNLGGIGLDYWNLITEKSHLKSKCVVVKNFKTSLNSIKNKTADVILATGITDDRKEYALFTNPYVTFPFVIATRNNIGFIENLNILNNKTIAVGKNYTAERMLEKYYPNLKLLLVKDTKEALRMVENGKAFGAVDILPVISYNINQYQFSTLKISDKLPYNFDVRFMVRKDYPELIIILNNSINSISNQEKNQISQKWIPVVYQQGISFETLKKYILIIFIIFLFFIAWIINKNKIANKLREAKEKAEAGAKAKAEFLANMSHEIRTPLNAMFGFIQILQEKEFDNETKKYLNIIEKSGKNLLTIINDILDFSKLESGKLHIENIEFNPKEEIDILHSLFESLAKQKNIILEKIEINLKFNIFSDSTRIKQVISNLISNSIKFTPNGNQITLLVEYNDKNETLYVEIKDNGIGIEENKLADIFKAFIQADNSTTRKYGGTGLGLSISYKLVKLLGGELKVESKIGKGSKFYFTIPAKKGNIISENKKTIKTLNNKIYNYHILLVEDNIANQMFMKVLLKKLGITFDIANDGLEAIEMFKNNKYDLILMDENMPNMNGLKATKKIREIEREKDLDKTIIIALTANALEGDKERFILAGMDYYLSKPLDLEKLKNILNKLEK